MSDLNCISFTGRLGKDAELKFAQSGTPIWSANVGCGYGYGDKRGTNWLKVQVFGKRAESLGKLDLTKGTQVAVTGELRLREYEHNGSKGWAHEVIASEVHLLGSPKVSDQPTRQSQPRQQPAPMDDFADDDLRF
jgi:single-strand DNA-binding protein